MALINDEATLKRYYLDKKKHKVRLHPENDEMEDMFFDKVDMPPCLYLDVILDIS